MKGNLLIGKKMFCDRILSNIVRFKEFFHQMLINFFWGSIVGLVCFLCNPLTINAQKLSSHSRISILTCGPGEVLYEAFGHSAVRITDPAQGLDLVFNYGVFDFNQKNFYGNFAKGSMRYMLGLSTGEDFLNQYRNYNRSVREQVLNLDSLEKQSIVDYLSNNLKPENREYYYDYFDNNCSTKILELLDSALNHNVVFTYSDIIGTASFRSLIYDYTTYQQWGRFGIDLGLGSVIDRSVNGKQLNFLPDELEKTISKAKIRRGMIEFPLVSENKILFESPVYYGSESYFLLPAFLFSLILLILAIFWGFSGGFPVGFMVVRSILLTVVGLLGIFLLSIWLFTNHKSAAWNYNILWANPIFFIVGSLIWIFEKRFRFFLSGFQYYLFAILFFWFIFPQQLNVNLIPLIGATLIALLPLRIKNKQIEGKQVGINN